MYFEFIYCIFHCIIASGSNVYIVVLNVSKLFHIIYCVNPYLAYKFILKWIIFDNLLFDTHHTYCGNFYTLVYL